MGVVDELLRARETFERGDWAAAYAVWTDVPPEEPADLIKLAMAAQLCGRHAECVETLQRGFHVAVGAGDREHACRCAFHLGMLFTEVGEHGLGSGWAGRAQRLLEEIGPDTLEAGYVAHLLMFRRLSRTTIPRPWRTPTRCWPSLAGSATPT